MTRLTVRQDPTGTSGGPRHAARHGPRRRSLPRWRAKPASSAVPSNRFAPAIARRRSGELPARGRRPGRISGAAFDEPDTDPPGDESEISEYEPIDYEISELLDFGTPTDPEAGALGQIRDLYQTAETVSQASLDRHFEQLLERQRELISEYFKESLDSAEASTPAEPVAPAVPSAPLGFDTAQSLASLRGELRGAQ